MYPNKPKTNARPDQIDSCLVSLRLAPLDETVNHRRHVDLQLNLRQRQILRRMFDAALAEDAQLTSGRFVKTAADTIRYLLEQVAAAELAALEVPESPAAPASKPRQKPGPKPASAKTKAATGAA